MKKIIFTLVIVLLSISLWAVVPDKISFQTVIRDSNGQLVAEKPISIRISILEGAEDQEDVYVENHSIQTNRNGLASIFIGAGETEDDFGAVQWQNDGLFVKTEVDINGGTDYELSVTSQLVSVPYAIHAQTAESISGKNVELDYTTLLMGGSEKPNIYINDQNQMLFFTKESDSTRPDLRKDIQLAPDVRLWGYSSEYHLDKSGVINLQAVDSLSKPAIVWYNPEGERKAAIVGHEFSGGHNNRHNHWSIETSNETGELHTRMEFPFDSSIICIETHSADFKVGDKGKFITTGNFYSYNSSKVGFGDKDWEVEGLEGSAKWEMYRATNTATLLVHQGSGERSAVLALKSGTNDWEVANEGNFKISSESHERLTITPEGKVGIGVEAPSYELDVDGEINTSEAYLTNGADYAEYFQCEGNLNVGDVVGINLENGLVGKYTIGYELIGVVSENAGFIGNNASGRGKDVTYVLVGLQGQLPTNASQVTVRNGKVYTSDNKQLGVMLANEKVYLKIRD